MYSISDKRYSYNQKREAKTAAAQTAMFSLGANQFQEQNTDLDTLVYYIKEGRLFTHVFKNDLRKNENFLYTSIIPIDVDDCPKSLEETLDGLEKKPTIAYYTASNLKEEGSYRFRFIYVFDERIDRCNYTPLVKAVENYLN